MQHPCQLRFLLTRDTDTSRYTTLKMGRKSEAGREDGSSHCGKRLRADAEVR
jgi:hypothetical protein